MNRAHQRYEKQSAARAKLVDAARKISAGQAELRDAVVEARAAELTQTEIAQLGNISRPTVAYWLKEQAPRDRPSTEKE